MKLKIPFVDASGNPVTQSIVSVTDASGNPVTGTFLEHLITGILTHIQLNCFWNEKESKVYFYYRCKWKPSDTIYC